MLWEIEPAQARHHETMVARGVTVAFAAVASASASLEGVYSTTTASSDDFDGVSAPDQQSTAEPAQIAIELSQRVVDEEQMPLREVVCADKVRLIDVKADDLSSLCSSDQRRVIGDTQIPLKPN